MCGGVWRTSSASALSDDGLAISTNGSDMKIRRTHTIAVCFDAYLFHYDKKKTTIHIHTHHMKRALRLWTLAMLSLTTPWKLHTQAEISLSVAIRHPTELSIGGAVATSRTVRAYHMVDRTAAYYVKSVHRRSVSDAVRTATAMGNGTAAPG